MTEKRRLAMTEKRRLAMTEKRRLAMTIPLRHREGHSPVAISAEAVTKQTDSDKNRSLFI